MITATKKKQQPFFPLFEKFIKESKNGKRLQPNGKRISPGTVANYQYAGQLLQDFCAKYEFTLRFQPVHRLGKRELQAVKKYWKKFYMQFTQYLYQDCGHFDNYVGQTLKIVRTFFNYLNKEHLMGVGEFHKMFFVRKEDVPVITLLPEELNFLIYNQDFHESLPRKLRIAKNVFVFGCTVALRFSDLMSLTRANLRSVNDAHYLVVRSKKTSTETQVKLPDYAVDILKSFKLRTVKLLPQYYLSTFNDYVKSICEKAGFTQVVGKQRGVRGKLEPVVKSVHALVIATKKDKQYRFCDLVSSHTMRRTAITTMLCLDVPEQVVRKISGHSPMSKEFFRYVSLAQAYQDKEVSLMHEKLREKQMYVQNIHA